MTVRLTVLLVAMMAIVGLAVGCGDSDDGGNGAATADDGNGAATADDSLSTDSSGNGDSDSESGGDTTVSTTSLSKLAYVKKADALCGREAMKVVTYQTDPQLTEPEAVAELIEKSMIPAFRRVAEGLRAIGAPAEEEGRLESYLEALEGSLDELEEQSASFSSIPEIEKLLHFSGQRADELGISKCAFG